jgi:ribosomal protein S18 acetylase RimI-like enzyme
VDVVIRVAVGDDARALSVLASQTFTETFGPMYPPEDLKGFLAAAYEPAKLRAEIEAKDSLWLVALRDGRAIGYAQSGPCKLPHPDVKPTDGELKRLYVLREHHNGGTGRQLLARSLSFLDGRNRDPQWIGVYSQNFGAQRLYARHGFQKVGEYEFPVGATRDLEFILRRGR